MKLGIFSHCTIDSIAIGDSTSSSSYQQVVGGAACYGGLTARNLKFDVQLYTKFGPDFTHDEYLSNNNIKHDNALSDEPTTRFKINISGSERSLSLENRCEPILYCPTCVNGVAADGFIVSPVFDEISPNTFEKIKKDSSFVFLDPQGFVRRTDSNKKIFLEKTEVNLSGIHAIKAGSDEIASLTGGNTGIEGMLNLQKRGVENVLFTNKKEISLLVKDRIYWITLPDLELFDTTGIGDIFGTTFCCTMLKERDFLWALCFAGGAAQAALETGGFGLNKIPKKGAIETNASYFYNLLKFKEV